MAEEDVIVPTSGNPALDPTRAVSGLAGAIATASKTASDDVASKFVGRPRKEGDSRGYDSKEKSSVEGYWQGRMAMESMDRANGIEPRPKHVMGEAVGGGGGGGGRRSGKFGISNSTARDYGSMKFKSPVFRDAAFATYTCLFPLSGYLPQVCGPFRPITTETIGGYPQSMAQESSQTGLTTNMDEV